MNEDRIQLFSKAQVSGFDNITLYKDIILSDLQKDSDLLELLDNSSLSPARPQDYIDTNIFSYLRIPDSQSVVKNFVCFELDEVDTLIGNQYKAVYDLTFRCIVHESEVTTPWGINRHDLIGAIIKDRYNYSNLIGNQLVKIVDKGYITEGNVYYYRVLKFQTVQNNEIRHIQKLNLLDQNRDKYDRSKEY